MELLTESISAELKRQYPQGSDLENQQVVAKLFDPCGSWSWYLLNQDPEDLDYLYAVVRGFEIELGSVSLSELEGFKGRLGIGIERDLHFTPMNAAELWLKLQKGEHV